MNREAGWIFLRSRFDISCSDGREHLCGSDRHIFSHGLFVFVPGATYLERRNTPSVEFCFVQLDVILVVGQALAESIKAESPRAGPAHRFLEVGAERHHLDTTFPSLAKRSALISIAAQELGMLRLYVAEARDVDAVWPTTDFNFVFVARNVTFRAGAHDVVHEIVAELATGVREAVGEFRC